ncbi:uncharacterized protein N7496_012439 [Penicillium cataractarum]|uniref:Uncharacterized protein n=1 Tax=Penicillium cataractarum TaxID=2100454 RepID=A0A9W9US11_9EURO|nr:uncharacterized protein N7496_012439 [Penicillium cataractarum]KAJ5355227.1 hypothetical protein N7496_012439 [Penicillium cataractarum]
MLGYPAVERLRPGPITSIASIQDRALNLGLLLPPTTSLNLPSMTLRTVHLIASRNAEAQRAHFAIFVPADGAEQGTLIEAVGAPMAGYMLEFKRNYSPSNDSIENYEIIPIGEIDSANIVDDDSGIKSADADPRGDIEIVASQIPTPGISENFLAPVNDTTNRRDQEWTMEYIRHLVSKRLIGSQAIQIVHSKRDPPTHGLDFQPSLRRSG